MKLNQVLTKLNIEWVQYTLIVALSLLVVLIPTKLSNNIKNIFNIEYLNINTFGSEKEFFKKKLNIGFALQYYIMDYLYEDIFPVDSFSDDCSMSCEKVTESNISLITTLQWSF